MSSQYLRTYFAERNLTNRLIHITIESNDHHDGDIHMIDSDEVIRMIVDVAPANEQEQIATMIRKIEWSNPSAIHGFIDHLAECFCKTYWNLEHLIWYSDLILNKHW